MLKTGGPSRVCSRLKPTRRVRPLRKAGHIGYGQALGAARDNPHDLTLAREHQPYLAAKVQRQAGQIAGLLVEYQVSRSRRLR